MVLSSRDRRYVTVEMVWLGPSLERRRLRFSFQFNDVKDRDRLSPAPLFSAGGRRRRLSSGRPRSCQSIVSVFFAVSRKLRNLAQKPLSGRRGASLISPAIRLRLGNLAPSARKSRSFSTPDHLSGAAPETKSGVSSRLTPLSQSALSNSSRRRPANRMISATSAPARLGD